MVDSKQIIEIERQKQDTEKKNLYMVYQKLEERKVENNEIQGLVHNCRRTGK